MAVENFKSTEVTARDSLAVSYFDIPADYARMRVLPFSITTAKAGDANSTFELVDLPSGRVRVLGYASCIKHSAFGTARTLDVGLSAYRKIGGTSDTTADEDALHSAADVAAAGSFAPHDELATGMLVVNSKYGATITAKCESGAVPSGATLKGYFVILVD